MKIRDLMRKARKLLPLALGIVAVAALLKMTVLAPPKVKAVPLERRDLTAQVYGNGTVEARIVVAVSSKVTSRIVELRADQGDRVRAGDLLARLESGELAGEVRQTEASVRRAKAAQAVEGANLRKALADLELAERNARRFRTLAEQNLVSRLEAEQYENTWRVAREEVARSRAALDSARTEEAAGRASQEAARARLTDTLITAPRDGIVISRDLEAGDVVAPGQSIFTLTDPSVVWVTAHVDEALLGGVAVGQKAFITLRSSPGTPLPGRVARIARQSDRVTEEAEVDVAFERPLENFRLGEQADVLIATATRKNVPALPAAALARRGGERGVWTVKEGRLRFVPLRLGIEDRRGFAELLSGVEGGAQVVTAPPETLRKLGEGKKVRVVE